VVERCLPLSGEYHRPAPQSRPFAWPLTDEILDAAIAAGVDEADDLDWKSELPPAKGLPQTDFPKDIVAMANSGGGMIVYGVEEDLSLDPWIDLAEVFRH
jgi:hypothetical protein